MMGGGVGVKSEEDKGSTFWLTLTLKSTDKNNVKDDLQDFDTKQLEKITFRHVHILLVYCVT